MNTSGGSLLSVRDLTVSFTPRRSRTTTEVVSGLDLDVSRGESVALVGESGSGKTVSMRAVLGVLPELAHVTGSAVFDGQELISMPEAELRRVRGARVGMVFQNAMSALNPIRTLKVQLTEHLRWHGISSGAEATQRAIDALERVGISEPAKRLRMYPFQLSGGQRQRAMIAMAIVAGPEILIADEPTTALDVTIQRQVLDLLVGLREDGLAIVMITHDLGVAKYLCDGIAVMRNGQIIETGGMNTVIAAPTHSYTQQLLAATLDTITEPASVGPDTPTASDDDTAVTALAESEPGVRSVADEAVTADAEAVEGGRELVQVRDLVKTFHGRGGDIAAVTGVDFAISPGEAVGVVGESGSGKSTLARLITRLIEPTEGSITFDGTDVVPLTGASLKRWRRRVQMVFQNPYSSLLPHLTVASNIAEPMRVHSVGTKASRRERAVELLKLVGVPAERADHYPRQFSGGQQQRIAIAQALALEPELLICDEPTSALDVSIQAQILDLLQHLQTQLGLSMLFITHNLAVAARLCDRTIVMSGGRIIEMAPTSELFKDPQHPYTEALLAAVLPLRTQPVPTRDHAVCAAGGTSGELTETKPGHWVRTQAQPCSHISDGSPCLAPASG